MEVRRKRREGAEARPGTSAGGERGTAVGPLGREGGVADGNLVLRRGRDSD